MERADDVFEVGNVLQDVYENVQLTYAATQNNCVRNSF